jgi:hypothetical protein
MSPEDQNIAIAKICGWKLRWQNCGGGPLFEVRPEGHCWGVWTPPAIWYQSKEGLAFTRNPESWNPQPPNYLNDLNAMHEAEKILNWADQNDYLIYLWNDKKEDHWELVHKSAAQRAEAFLKTLNMWKE